MSQGTRSSVRLLVASIAVVSLVAVACGQDDTGDGGGGTAIGDLGSAMQQLERQDLPDWVPFPDVSEVETRGNVGEEPTWYTDVAMTEDQVEEVRGMGLKAAFLNWSSGAYNQAVLAGTRDALQALGIELVAVTNYNFDQAQLQTDVQNVMPLDPDIIFYSGIDLTADRAALQPAVNEGVAVVSFANAPGDWTTGEPDNFVTLISYDTHGNGAAVAREVADRFPDGDLGMIFFDATYKLVNEREQGFVNALGDTDVEIEARQPMSDPAATQEITSAMIARNPELDVIFAPWDLPADGVVAALSGANADIPVAHIDLGFTGATHIACDNGPIFVMSSQLVYEWGRTGAIAAALHALGEEVPPYVIVPVFAVTEENLEEGWDLAYGGVVPLPGEARNCLEG